jgi:hypothetical protein
MLHAESQLREPEIAHPHNGKTMRGSPHADFAYAHGDQNGLTGYALKEKAAEASVVPTFSPTTKDKTCNGSEKRAARRHAYRLERSDQG